MARIERQDDEDVVLAKRALAWVYFAREPLHAQLLQYALAIQPGDSIVDQDGCVEGHVITSLSGGLIVVDKESQITRFVHPTTRSYFEKYFTKQNQPSEDELTLGCLTFLLSESFDRFPLPHIGVIRPPHQDGTEEPPGVEMSRARTFSSYACRYLITHFRSTERREEILTLMKALFSDNEFLWLFWEIRRCHIVGPYGWYLNKISDTDKLCIASFLGLDEIVYWLIKSGCSPNEYDSTGQTALYAAAAESENSVIEVLLDHGAQPDKFYALTKSNSIYSNIDRPYQTLMHCALRHGNLDLVKRLQNRGFTLECAHSPILPVTPLHIAIQSQHRETVDFVLRKRPQDLHVLGPDEHPPLHEAIKKGALDVIECLLVAEASSTVVKNRDWAPIQTAIESSQVSDAQCSAICSLILQHAPLAGSFLTSTAFRESRSRIWTYRPQTLINLLAGVWKNAYIGPGHALHELWDRLNSNSPQGCDELIRELNSCELTQNELQESKVLLFAINRGWKSAVSALLQLGDDLGCSSDFAIRGLYEAIQCYDYGLIDVLLDFGVDSPTLLAIRSPLTAAFLSNDLRMLEYLLKKGIRPSTLCITTCFETLGPPGYFEAAIQLTVDYCTDINTTFSPPGILLRALASLSTQDSVSTIKHCIQRGASCDLTGGLPYTAMAAAAASSGFHSLEVMNVLHSAGADVNIFGGTYGTALLAAANTIAYESYEKVIILLEWGADPDLPGPGGTFAEVAARHTDARVQNMVPNDNGPLQSALLCEMLMSSAAYGDIATLINAIERGADVNSEAAFLGGISTPLAAATISNDIDDLDKMQFLIAHGADVNSPVLGYSNVLQLALDYKPPIIPLIECLLNAQVDINAPSGPHGCGTALEITFRRFNYSDPEDECYWQEIITLLCRNGALPCDDDMERLAQFPWFLEAMSADSTLTSALS